VGVGGWAAIEFVVVMVVALFVYASAWQGRCVVELSRLKWDRQTGANQIWSNATCIRWAAFNHTSFIQH
jgi:hypothetical protein